LLEIWAWIVIASDDFEAKSTREVFVFRGTLFAWWIVAQRRSGGSFRLACHRHSSEGGGC
jgi:hypothetical protein